MTTRLAQPSSPAQTSRTPSSAPLREPLTSKGDKPRKARILQDGFASESDMNLRPQSATGQKSKDRAPASAPASSQMPTSRSVPSDPPEYTDEGEDTRVRATSGRASDPPESTTEVFSETGETFTPESDAA